MIPPRFHSWLTRSSAHAHATPSLRGCTRATSIAILTIWHLFLPWILQASAAAPRAVSAVLAAAHSTPSAFRHATCFIAYGLGCATGIATRYVDSASSQTGVVTGRLGHALAARALIGKRRPKSACHSSTIWKTFAGACLLLAIVDSGCTWHSHPEVRDLINVRPSTDKISCTGGVIHHASHIGDLPVVCHNQEGNERVVLVRDVRCVRAFTDTLISVRQLWKTSEIDTIFRDVDALSLPQPRHDGTAERLPFRYEDGVYLWRVGATARASHLGAGTAPLPQALAGRDTSGTHGAHATSHIEALSPDEIVSVLHRRLHISLDRIRRLATCTSDAPRAVLCTQGKSPPLRPLRHCERDSPQPLRR